MSRPRGLAFAIGLSVALGADLAGAEALAHEEHLAPFFAELRALESRAAKRDAIVTVWGDSHTAADGWTSVVRSELQGRFGSGGRGFVTLGKPWRSHGQKQVTFTNGGGCEGHTILDREPDPDGAYGLGGAFVLCRGKHASVSTTFKERVDAVAIQLGGSPFGGTVDLTVDGTPAGSRNLHMAAPSAISWVAQLPPDAKEITVRSRDGKPFRAYGVSAHRHEAGVVVDALGVNGARAENLERIDEVHLAQAVGRRRPSLLVLAYGTNEAGDDGDLAAYAEKLRRVLEKLRRGAPQAACLLVGPPDRSERVGDHWETMTRIVAIAELQRRIAQEARCAYFDTLTAIGGPGTIELWGREDPPRAQRDHVHYTWLGYQAWGQALADELLAAYARARPVR
jgi:lysophospholipase L1-like esterase